MSRPARAPARPRDGTRASRLGSAAEALAGAILSMAPDAWSPTYYRCEHADFGIDGILQITLNGSQRLVGVQVKHGSARIKRTPSQYAWILAFPGPLLLAHVILSRRKPQPQHFSVALHDYRELLKDSTDGSWKETPKGLRFCLSVLPQSPCIIEATAFTYHNVSAFLKSSITKWVKEWEATVPRPRNVLESFLKAHRFGVADRSIESEIRGYLALEADSISPSHGKRISWFRTYAKVLHARLERHRWVAGGADPWEPTRVPRQVKAKLCCTMGGTCEHYEAVVGSQEWLLSQEDVSPLALLELAETILTHVRLHKRAARLEARNLTGFGLGVLADVVAAKGILERRSPADKRIQYVATAFRDLWGELHQHAGTTYEADWYEYVVPNINLKIVDLLSGSVGGSIPFDPPEIPAGAANLRGLAVIWFFWAYLQHALGRVKGYNGAKRRAAARKYVAAAESVTAAAKLRYRLQLLRNLVAMINGSSSSKSRT